MSYFPKHDNDDPLGENECARLLSQTLGEEESTDFLLTSLADPLLQQLWLDDAGADVDLGESGVTVGRGEAAASSSGKKKKGASQPKAA